MCFVFYGKMLVNYKELIVFFFSSLDLSAFNKIVYFLSVFKCKLYVSLFFKIYATTLQIMAIITMSEKNIVLMI